MSALPPADQQTAMAAMQTALGGILTIAMVAADEPEEVRKAIVTMTAAFPVMQLEPELKTEILKENVRDVRRALRDLALVLEKVNHD